MKKETKQKHAKVARDAKARATRGRKAEKAMARSKKSPASMSDTTRKHAVALVEAIDERRGEAEKLKGERGELRGKIVGHERELEETVKDEDLDDYEARKKATGLEKDLQRWRMKLGEVNEQLSAAKEDIKENTAGLFQLVRDWRDGNLLFEKGKPAKGADPRESSGASGETGGKGEVVASGETRAGAAA